MIASDRRRANGLQAIARRWRVGCGLTLIGLALLPVLGEDKSSPEGKAAPAAAPQLARLVVVQVPLQGAEVEKIVGQVQAAVARLPKEGNTRPLLILEFASPEGTAGEGTKFPDALKLAMTLTSE